MTSKPPPPITTTITAGGTQRKKFEKQKSIKNNDNGTDYDLNNKNDNNINVICESVESITVITDDDVPELLTVQNTKDIEGLFGFFYLFTHFVYLSCSILFLPCRFT